MKLPELVRKPAGPVELKPEQQKISGYFNLDNGCGKIRGIYLAGKCRDRARSSSSGLSRCRTSA